MLYIQQYLTNISGIFHPMIATEYIPLMLTCSFGRDIPTKDYYNYDTTSQQLYITCWSLTIYCSLASSLRWPLLLILLLNEEDRNVLHSATKLPPVYTVWFMISHSPHSSLIISTNRIESSFTRSLVNHVALSCPSLFNHLSVLFIHLHLSICLLIHLFIYASVYQGDF